MWDSDAGRRFPSRWVGLEGEQTVIKARWCHPEFLLTSGPAGPAALLLAAQPCQRRPLQCCHRLARPRRLPWSHRFGSEAGAGGEGLDGGKCQFLVPHPFLVALSFLCHRCHLGWIQPRWTCPSALPQRVQLLAPSLGLAPRRNQGQLWRCSPTAPITRSSTRRYWGEGLKGAAPAPVTAWGGGEGV